MLLHVLFCLQLSLPMTNMFPGSELTKEPFRWDQRLFALVLRMGGVPSLDTEKEKPMSRSLVNVDDSPINAMCEVTGGKCKDTQHPAFTCCKFYFV